MGNYLNKLQQSSDSGDYTTLVDKLGELIIGLVVICGGGALIVVDGTNRGVLTLVSASIGAVISYYYQQRGRTS